MRALFAVPFTNSNPVLPPMDDANGGLQLVYTVDGERRGGFSVVGHVPFAPTCLVLVDSSEAAIAAMATHPDYLFLEEVMDDAEAV